MSQKTNQTLYLATLPRNSPLITDPAVNFASARLNEQDSTAPAVEIDGHPHEVLVTGYPCKSVMSVSKGAYETIVAMCADESGLAQRLVTATKDEPVLAYFRYDEMPSVAHTYCGGFHLSSLLRLAEYPGANWQIVLSQRSQARPKARYDDQT